MRFTSYHCFDTTLIVLRSVDNEAASENVIEWYVVLQRKSRLG